MHNEPRGSLAGIVGAPERFPSRELHPRVTGMLKVVVAGVRLNLSGAEISHIPALSRKVPRPAEVGR